MKNCLKETPEGVYLQARLQPRASRNHIAGEQGGFLKIYVTAPPVDSAANQALVELLADRLDMAKSAVQLVCGQTSRQKTIFLRGVDAAYILGKLA